MVVVAIGIAAGSIIAARTVELEESVKILPVGIAAGFAVAAMMFVREWHIACVLLFIIGALSGYLIVPLNALLQHRGHILIGAGHSIAVQNFNENLGIAVLIGAYTLMVKGEMSMNTIILIFGLFVSLVMAGIYRHYIRLTSAKTSISA